MTDRLIVRETLRLLGRPFDDAVCDALLARYVEHLRTEIHGPGYAVLPGVQKTLEALRARGARRALHRERRRGRAAQARPRRARRLLRLGRLGGSAGSRRTARSGSTSSRRPSPARLGPARPAGRAGARRSSSATRPRD